MKEDVVTQHARDGHASYIHRRTQNVQKDEIKMITHWLCFAHS